MDIDEAVETAIGRADALIKGERAQLMVIFDVDGDITEFEFECVRFTYSMVHRTGSRVAYLHPECAVLVTRTGQHLAVAAQTRNDEYRWELIPIEGERLGEAIVLDRVLFQSVHLFWEGVQEGD